ncbi:hypothetical protein BDK51DRAFT_20472, partial [Blyttiomyces helicus]
MAPPPPFPYEVYQNIFAHLDATTPQRFTLVSRSFASVARDPHSRAGLFLRLYGRALALHHTFRSHRGALTPEVGRLMLRAGAGLPRFLVQLVDKEYHRSDRSRKAVPVALFAFFIRVGFEIYGADADFKEDVSTYSLTDVGRFERLLYGSTAASPTSLSSIETLLTKYRFVPVRGLGSPPDETVYLVSKLSMPLIRHLVANGLDLSTVNDQVMERVLWRADVSDASLQPYLDIGFSLTPSAMKKGLQMARPATLDALRRRVDAQALQRLAEETLHDMLGPSAGRGWNWVPESADYLMRTFSLGDDVAARALLTHPDAPLAPNGARVDFPATRCYMKANPCPVWRWVLKTYGASHPFAAACFDDALSRAAADRDLHALHDTFLDAGMRFAPRHVKILACRVLHRDMTANALHLMQVLRAQVAASDLADEERAEWVAALRDEVVDNEEWGNRMRTTQLEGGARG